MKGFKFRRLMREEFQKKTCRVIEITCAKLRLCTSAPLILIMASPGCKEGHCRLSQTLFTTASCPPCPPAVTLKPIPPPSLLPKATGTSSPPPPQPTPPGAPGDPRPPGRGRGGLLAGHPLKPQGGCSVGGTTARDVWGMGGCWVLGAPGGGAVGPTSGRGRGSVAEERSLSEDLEL